MFAWLHRQTFNRVWLLPAVITCAAALLRGDLAAADDTRVTLPGTLSARPREAPNDPPAPAHVLAQRGIEPARVWVQGSLVSVQVNVDSFGNNIIGDGANEPSIAINATDPSNIVIGWRQFDHPATSDYREAGWASSADGGQTWPVSGVLEDGVFRSDPVLAADADGNFYYNSITRVDDWYFCDVFKSTDDGASWPTKVYAYGGDKAWMAIDQTAGPGRGNIYANWDFDSTCCPPNDFTRSTNGGASFDTLLAIREPKLKWGTMDVGPSGALYLAGVDFVKPFPGHVFARSTDAKDPKVTPTFDLVQSVDLGGWTLQGGSVNPQGLMGQVWIATDHSSGPTHGNVYIAGSVIDPAYGLHVRFIRSVDGGQSWSLPVTVNDYYPCGVAIHWFGTMSVAPNGRIDVIWNDTRNDDVGNLLSEVFYSFSVDAGYTWSTDVPVTKQFDPSIGYPHGDYQHKLGDYYHMISDNGGANLAYAATFNGEQDIYFLRIQWDCDGNGIEDHCDVACGAEGSRCDFSGCGEKPDCNGNTVPDECDITAETSCDIGGNGVPDECEGLVPDPPEAEMFGEELDKLNSKNRYLSFTAGDPGQDQGIRVTFVDLPLPFDCWNGMKFFVGRPKRICENAGQTTPPQPRNPPNYGCGPAPGLDPPWLWAAPLVCEPEQAHLGDWSGYGVVHVYHEGIVPSGVYDIQVIDAACPLQAASAYSAPLTMTQARWGDVCGPGPGGACSGVPDGVVDVPNDVLGVLNKYTNTNDLQKARADLEPGDDAIYAGTNNGPDLIVQVSNDVLEALAAYGGAPYPFLPGDQCAPG